MRVLFVGGTGLISTACTRLALERGIEVVHLNRSSGVHPIEGVATLVADVHDEAAAERALAGQRFDAVVDRIAYGAEDIERDIRLFHDRTDQFIFISSASAYMKPLGQWLIREDTPLANPYWDYSRGKIAAEERCMRALRDEGFPMTIVRPAHTYGNWSMPLAVSSWKKPYSSNARWRAGKALIVPGDGQTLWTLTHNSDFAVGLVGLLGRRQAIGHAFHIVSDEALTWDEIHRQTAAAAGADCRIVHIPTDFIAACRPEMSGRLIGDASVCAVFDNSKIRRFVPESRPVMPYAEGIKQTIAWYDADPAPGSGHRDGRMDGPPDRRLRSRSGEREGSLRPLTNPGIRRLLSTPDAREKQQRIPCSGATLLDGRHWPGPAVPKPTRRSGQQAADRSEQPAVPRHARFGATHPCEALSIGLRHKRCHPLPREGLAQEVIHSAPFVWSAGDPHAALLPWALFDSNHDSPHNVTCQ